MSLDAVKRVMEVEKQASQQREGGEREARRRITAAARLYEEIKAEGERHLDQAAEWIVRRVVEF